MPVATSLRMINVFGQREPELAAIKILDLAWERPLGWWPIAGLCLKEGYEAEGFILLRRRGWIQVRGERFKPTRAFWQRVHGR